MDITYAFERWPTAVDPEKLVQSGRSRTKDNRPALHVTQQTLFGSEVGEGSGLTRCRCQRTRQLT